MKEKGYLYKVNNSEIICNLLLDLIELFLYSRRQKVVLNGKSSNWKFVKAVVKESLFFFIYINDLAQGLIPDVKLFADDTSLFSIFNCAKASALVLNINLLKLQNWAYKW